MTMSTPRSPLLAGLGALILVSGCAGESRDTGPVATVPAAEKPVHSHATIKPGADLTFEHGDVAKVAPGQNGSVQVTVRDGYDSGMLEVTSTGSEGLDVFGAEARVRFDMAAGDRHEFRLAYAAEAAGTYYINLHAQVSAEGEPASMRAYAIRVVIGDAAAVASKPAVDTLRLPDGQTAIILEAEETID